MKKLLCTALFILPSLALAADAIEFTGKYSPAPDTECEIWTGAIKISIGLSKGGPNEPGAVMLDASWSSRRRAPSRTVILLGKGSLLNDTTPGINEPSRKVWEASVSNPMKKKKRQMNLVQLDSYEKTTFRGDEVLNWTGHQLVLNKKTGVLSISKRFLPRGTDIATNQSCQLIRETEEEEVTSAGSKRARLGNRETDQ